MEALILFGKWMRAREIAHTKRDDNRVVRPFQWGLEFINIRGKQWSAVIGFTRNLKLMTGN